MNCAQSEAGVLATDRAPPQCLCYPVYSGSDTATPRGRYGIRRPRKTLCQAVLTTPGHDRIDLARNRASSCGEGLRSAPRAEAGALTPWGDARYLPALMHVHVQVQELSVVYAPDPASLVLGDSRRSTCHPEVFMRIPGPSRPPTVAPRAGVPDLTKLAPNVPPRVACTGGLVRANSGGPRPDRIQRPAAATRNGGSGECSGRSRRWRRPWMGGIGGATAYLPACRAGARRYQKSRFL